MSDRVMWKYLDETKHFLKELETEILRCERELLDAGGLITSPVLEREYCRAIGYIDGLRYIKVLIEESRDE